MKTFDGYKKRALTDEYALLAGGGHKPLSDFSTSSHTHSIKINGVTKTIAASGGAAVDLGNYKTILTAVTSPTASGTSISFIDTISLNTNGVITTTKKTVPTMGGATASAAGTVGLVPAPASNLHTLFLKGDGTWATPSDTHWTTHLYVGAKDAASNAATTNGNTYIKVTDNSTIRNQYIIKGAGRATVASDASGNITITSPTVTWSEISGKPSTFTPSAHNHPTSQINALTSYTKATAAAELATTDSLNTALGKLEYKLDVAYDLVTKANDSDGTIENLKEILDVLAGIKDTDTIQAIIGKYLPLAGGIMTGQIQKAGVNTSWINGRSNAFLRTTTISGYSPFASVKTNNGSWEIGVYEHSSYLDNLIFTYFTDDNYNSGNNSTTAQIRFLKNGQITASITGNATTASKLLTARNIWGQPFDGTANVQGSLTDVTSITASGIITTTGSICINKSSGTNNYNEGIRCNLGGSSNWASVVLGGASGSTSGSGDGVYSLLVNSKLFRIRLNTTDVLTINTSNNVGIGTTSPAAKLHIYQTSNTYSNYGTYIYDTGNSWAMRTLVLQAPNITSGSAPIILIGKADSAKNSGWMGYVHSSDGSANNRLSFGLYNVDNVLNILGSGNVGIGTTSPSYKLHVAGQAAASGFVKSESSDSYVLLGAGGHKAVSDFAAASALGNYVTLTGNLTISGVKTFSTLLKFTVAQGTSPFAVTSTTAVTNLNADLLDGNHSTSFHQYNAPKYIRSTKDYQRIVIALCETCGANTELNSYSSGELYRQISNGLIPMYVAHVSFDSQYLGALAANYGMFSNFENTSSAVRSGEGYRACTFTYNGKTYAGIEFYLSQAAAFYWHGTGNFNVFAVVYYNLSSGAVLNSEINDSLAYNKCTRKEYYLKGNATSSDKWKTARTLTIGNTGKSVDGSANVSWSLAEIGAASSSHTHTTSLAADTGTSSITLAYSGKYKLTTGGTSVIFTMPASDNTNTAHTTFAWTGGTTAGPTGTLSGNHTAVNFPAIPSASSSASGIVTTGALTFAGSKTFNAVVHLLANQYTDSAGTGALNLNNSDIYGVNSIKFADLSDTAAEGLQWYRDSTHVDSIWVKSGVIYFTPNREWSKTGTNYTIAHSGNGSTYFTAFSGGGISSSGNILTQANHSITIGGQTRTAGSSSCNIINSLSVSKATSSATTNLTLGITVNGIVSSDKTIANLHATCLNNTSVSDLASASCTLNKQGVQWFSLISASSGYAGNNYGFPASNNANGILYLGTHALSTANAYYGGQLGVSSNGRLYYRFSNGSAWSTAANGGSWKTIAWTTDNVASASKWATARTITLTGSVTGSVSIDGSKDVTLATTTNHTHTFESLTSKPTTLGGYGITDALKIDGSNGTAAGVSTLINKLTTGTAAPTDSDYYVCLAAGGGTTTTTYHRRPMSAMWSWIKAKTDALYPGKDGTGASGTWGISITGNAATATKLTSSAGSSTLPIYFSGGKPVACTASSVFSNLSNSGNNISVTVAGQNRTLTVGYATNTDKLDGYHFSDLENRYVNVSGDFMSGILNIQTQALTKSNPTDQQLVINGPNYDENHSLTLQSWPGIGFHMPSRAWASLIWNGYFSGVNEDFTGYVGFYGSGFFKDGSNNNYVLLGGGGHKAVSDFAASSGVVTALGTKGNYVTWTKNGTVNNLTVPYATSAGTANKWTTARTLTIGNTGKSVDGSGNVSWTLAELGASDTTHTHTVKINGSTKTIAATGGTAVDLGTYLTAHQSVNNKAATLLWGTTSTIATIGSTDITLKMPSNPNTDTKNTAGSSNISSKIYLIGALSQSTSSVTYSHDTAYVSADGYLYSGGVKVLTSHLRLLSLTIQGNGDTIGTYTPNSAATINIRPVDIGAAAESHTHSDYLPLSGGTMDNNARISHNGKLYLGRADSAGWILCQDMCSLDYAGDTNWSLRTNGTLHAKTAIISGNIDNTTGNINTTGITSKWAFINTGDATLKIYDGKTQDAVSDGNICLQTSIDGTDGQSHFYPTNYGERCNIVLQPRGGQVYIGTNPNGGNISYKLYVNGSIYAVGSMYATSYYETSDITLKTNFSKISTTVEQISNLPVFDFSWKENLSSRNTGTSAQAVQTILPNIVTESSGSLKLNYGVLGTVAGIIACKELVIQKSEIEQLRERVIELEKQLNEYRPIYED